MPRQLRKAADALSGFLGRRSRRRHVLKSARQQRVAREDGHVLAEDLVARGPAAAVVVVVHAWQVVVDKAHCVDHLHADGSRRGQVPRLLREYRMASTS